jgi:hypothetical protein
MRGTSVKNASFSPKRVAAPLNVLGDAVDPAGCVAGEPDAQASLGACLHNGWGCEKDLEEAARWSRQAAENGNLRGMSDLAYYCLHGFGIEKDEEKGFQWAMKAAERGHAPAQAMVGECYLDGRGVERSEERGATWLYRAVRQGSKRAKMLLETR